jgi:hypothetical protein
MCDDIKRQYNNRMHVLPSIHSAHRQEIYIDAVTKFLTCYSYLQAKLLICDDVKCSTITGCTYSPAFIQPTGSKYILAQ